MIIIVVFQLGQEQVVYFVVKVVKGAKLGNV